MDKMTQMQAEAVNYLLGKGWQWQEGFDAETLIDGYAFIYFGGNDVAVNDDGRIEHEDVAYDGTLTAVEAHEKLGN